MKAHAKTLQSVSPPQTSQPLRQWIPVSEPKLCGKEREYVLDCLDTGWISSNGKYVTKFEEQFGAFVGVPHAIAVCNGTCALHVALEALGIGQGDEVIVPSFTYVASANAVRYTGAKPVFVDSEPDTWNVDPNKIEEAVTPRTRAIVPVHLYGHPCDMAPILDIASRKNLFVVEDAAEAFGSQYNGKMIGSLGTVATFSFFGNKTITTGEGGMVVTRDAKLADKIRLLKGQGVSPTRQYYFEVVGYNYRMTNIEAAIGLAQLENATAFIERKREIARCYERLLRGTQGLRLPVEKHYALNSYWMYSIVVDDSFGTDRNSLMAHLRACSVETRPFFYPCHLLPPYRTGSLQCPVAEDLGNRGINLPSSAKLTDSQIEYIVNCIQECAP